MTPRHLVIGLDVEALHSDEQYNAMPNVPELRAAFKGKIRHSAVKRIAEELFPPPQQGLLLFGDFVGQRMARPDLAMRVRIAGAHHGAAVFENLHVIDLGPGAEFLEIGRASCRERV